MSTAFPRRRALAHCAAAATVLALGAALVGCQPEPVTPVASPSATATPSATTPDPTPSPTAPAEVFALPGACEQLYSPAMLASLQQQAPLNDPGVTMTSTQVAGALEVLSSGVPTIRCTWGVPGETGLATNVSVIDAAQSAALMEELLMSGFSCADAAGATVCSYAQTMVDFDNNLVELTETHALREGGWVSTATIDFAPEGYTEDILATLWG